MPTHSSVESSKTWCFQIGTSALRVSISARDAAKASTRWAEVVAEASERLYGELQALINRRYDTPAPG